MPTRSANPHRWIIALQGRRAEDHQQELDCEAPLEHQANEVKLALDRRGIVGGRGRTAT
ncbi:MAG: hypothetical protein ACHQHO_04705 [Solirubrobacterales bacterium]